MSPSAQLARPPPLPLPTLPVCRLHGMELARVDRFVLLDHIFRGLAAGRGGWLVTANLDFLRRHAVAHNELYRTKILEYMRRHKVKPGITGWAQVNGLRGETDTL